MGRRKERAKELFRRRPVHIAELHLIECGPQRRDPLLEPVARLLYRIERNQLIFLARFLSHDPDEYGIAGGLEFD
jgi:hypothetical protein